jgi:hypothetical protein
VVDNIVVEEGRGVDEFGDFCEAALRGEDVGVAGSVMGVSTLPLASPLPAPESRLDDGVRGVTAVARLMSSTSIGLTYFPSL